MINLSIPITEGQILSLHAGDSVTISGIATTGRDAAHKYMVEKLIKNSATLSADDKRLFEELKSIYQGGMIYHCGPIVRNEEGKWTIISAGPTTSIREEVYEDTVISAFGLRVVMGKGGMGARTLAACSQNRAVYVHAIGGAGVTSAEKMTEVLDVFKLEEFGVPEAFWKVRFQNFPGIVTMDAHGKSLHEELGRDFDKRLAEILGS
jgi:fumarate hydratase class I